MRDITYVSAFFENQGQLVEQQTVWSAYPDDLKEKFHVVVTDDVSPLSPAKEVFQPVGIASYQLYRLGVKRDWDWLACRNLGVDKARTKWVLLTDIDHVLPAPTLQYILTADLDNENVYRFTRVDAHDCYPWAAGLTDYKQHPNTWMMTRKMFDVIGGYDERFSGHYGSDSEFRERVQGTARAVVTLPVPLVRYPREIIPDASTRADEYHVSRGLGFERKRKIDGEMVPRIKAERAKEPDWRPKRLQYIAGWVDEGHGRVPVWAPMPYTLEASA